MGRLARDVRRPLGNMHRRDRTVRTGAATALRLRWKGAGGQRPLHPLALRHPT